MFDPVLRSCVLCCVFSHVWLFVTSWTVAPRLLYPWDFSGKNTGLDCRFLLPKDLSDPGIKSASPVSPALQADSLPPSHCGSRFPEAVAKWSEVALSCLTLCDPMDCSLPGSSVHGIFQARVLEWVAISFSRQSSRPRDRTQVSRIPGRRFNL